MNNNFANLFKIKKPIIGMIHLAGDNSKERIKTALKELSIYEEEGVNGAIIEDYHGTAEDVWEALKESSKLNLSLILGVNILRNPYANFYSKNLGAKFVQFDSVQTKDLHLSVYDSLRKSSNEVVLGGIGFKYTKPTGNPLEIDLSEGMSRCDAIVTTGAGTGIETPTEKLIEYKKILRDFPLIVGAGVNDKNVHTQLEIADGAIVGSYFKKYSDTRCPVDREKVKTLMEIVNDLRK